MGIFLLRQHQLPKLQTWPLKFNESYLLWYYVFALILLICLFLSFWFYITFCCEITSEQVTAKPKPFLLLCVCCSLLFPSFDCQLDFLTVSFRNFAFFKCGICFNSGIRLMWSLIMFLFFLFAPIGFAPKGSH